MEVTTWIEALRWRRVALGGSATMRAATRVNAEQAPKREVAEADPPTIRGRLPLAGERATRAPASGSGTHGRGGW